MFEWLAAPLDATRVHDVGFHLSWHARLMVIAWGVLVPVGVLAARYFKILPGQPWPQEMDNRTWWNAHRFCQYSAVGLTAAAIALIKLSPDVSWASGIHYLAGWAVAALAAVQVGGGIFRGTKGGPTEPAPDGSWRGDHYDMTKRRIIFEYTHKTLGYVAMLVAAVAMISGLWQANAPRWMPLAIGAWWVFLLVLAVHLQRLGMCVDTYQAHWGTDNIHPGNNRERPIGFRIRRMEHPQPGDEVSN
ncbi:cytochrome b561 domain-containing protein [Hoeflea prorocentri]|uniref:Cytochrome b561 domain-containing protein n=1 Tax=Hoeflea prorocentri TaxID=1922333 RepID=A0A9X3UF39_9HYPH|nr:cytochrome b561 domain-containing protein [Hoeflea prorocentri]MCY6379720.1 cytochrome b561 domain-containing protein [Hoeflea prorocentri]MDA5397520.1 cytochrome b561 domain-containing protein [Hoeflea prorocentri]